MVEKTLREMSPVMVSKVYSLDRGSGAGEEHMQQNTVYGKRRFGDWRLS